jgi:hypothetical protein
LPSKADDALNKGGLILSELLLDYGFAFNCKTFGASSGGRYASGEFRRDNRILELHFRYSLGMVTYHLDDVLLSHEAYMLSVLGQARGSRYPGFSGDPLDGFRHLRDDLAQYGKDFLAGSDDEFLQHIERSANLAKLQTKIPL